MTTSTVNAGAGATLIGALRAFAQRATPRMSALMTSLRSAALVLVWWAVASGSVFAQSRVDRDAFTFDLPTGWGLLNTEGPKGTPKEFMNFNSHNASGEVIQFSVSNATA